MRNLQPRPDEAVRFTHVLGRAHALHGRMDVSKVLNGVTSTLMQDLREIVCVLRSDLNAGEAKQYRGDPIGGVSQGNLVGVVLIHSALRRPYYCAAVHRESEKRERPCRPMRDLEEDHIDGPTYVYLVKDEALLCLEVNAHRGGDPVVLDTELVVEAVPQSRDRLNTCGPEILLSLGVAAVDEREGTNEATACYAVRTTTAHMLREDANPSAE